MAFRMAVSMTSPGISVAVHHVKKSTLTLMRSLTVKPLTSNLKLVSTGSDVTTSPKPLAVIIPWLMAKDSAVLKYATFYTDQGFDVLVARTTPYQVMWPATGSQVVARELARFLQAHEVYRPIVLHGFSVAGYLWGETMLVMNSNLELYRATIDRVACQIWDSFAGVEEIPIGVPPSLFPRSKLMQKCLENCIRSHMRRNHDAATYHYITAGDFFYERTLITAPALFMVSKADPIGTVKNITRAHDNWRARGIQASIKCWEDSPHVGHFLKHPEEYVTAWSKLIASAGLLRFPEKFRARLGCTRAVTHS